MGKEGRKGDLDMNKVAWSRLDLGGPGLQMCRGGCVMAAADWEGKVGADFVARCPNHGNQVPANGGEGGKPTQFGGGGLHKCWVIQPTGS